MLPKSKSCHGLLEIGTWYNFIGFVYANDAYMNFLCSTFVGDALVHVWKDTNGWHTDNFSNFVKSGTFTSGSGSLSTNIIRKNGNVVNFTFVNSNCNIPFGTSFGTFPVGFRPSGNQNILCSGYITTTAGATNFCPIMTIEANGAIKQGVSSQITVKSYLISGTFIV